MSLVIWAALKKASGACNPKEQLLDCISKDRWYPAFIRPFRIRNHILGSLLTVCRVHYVLSSLVSSDSRSGGEPRNSACVDVTTASASLRFNRVASGSDDDWQSPKGRVRVEVRTMLDVDAPTFRPIPTTINHSVDHCKNKTTQQSHTCTLNLSIVSRNL